jgi:hypothetical protein
MKGLKIKRPATQHIEIYNGEKFFLPHKRTTKKMMIEKR